MASIQGPSTGGSEISLLVERLGGGESCGERVPGICQVQ